MVSIDDKCWLMDDIFPSKEVPALTRILSKSSLVIVISYDIKITKLLSDNCMQLSVVTEKKT